MDIELTNRARKELVTLDEMIDSFYKNGDIILLPQVEKAYAIRSDRVMKQLKLRRAIEKIYTPEEQLAINLLKVQLETKKTELNIKNQELQTKKIETNYKKIEATALGVDIKGE